MHCTVVYTVECLREIDFPGLVFSARLRILGIMIFPWARRSRFYGKETIEEELQIDCELSFLRK